MDNKLKILIAFPFVFIIILFIAAGYIPFKTGVTESEDRILTFIPSVPALKERQEAPAPAEMKIPFHFSAAAGNEMPEQNSARITDMDYNDDMLSMIVVSGQRKIAIIRGVLVREGDKFGDVKISKIEPERVLLKNKTERWLYLEKSK
jgi:hypothetical protein